MGDTIVEVVADPFPSSAAPVRRRDAWINRVTGMGTSADKRVHTAPTWCAPLPLELYRAVYVEDGIAATIVDAPVEGALRRGYTGPSPAARETAKALGFDSAFAKLCKWGRLYGGAILYLGIDDGLTPELPVGKAVRGVRNVVPISRQRVTIETYDEDPLSSRYGQPLVYRISGAGKNSRIFALVHASRVLRWDGVEADDISAERLSGWSWSVLHRPYEVIRDFASAYGSLAHLVNDAAQGVFYMKDLVDAVVADEAKVQARMFDIDSHRSVLNALVLDKEGEDFERKTTPLAGLPEVMDRLMSNLSAITGIPQAVLFGRAPAGMNATGESDLTLWYDRLRSEQCAMSDLVWYFYKLIDPKTPPIKFLDPWQPTDKELAELNAKKAETDAKDIASEVFMPEEATLLRVGTEEDKEKVLERIRVSRLALLSGPVEFAPEPAPPGAPGADPEAEEPANGPAEDDEEATDEEPYASEDDEAPNAA